MRVDNVLILAAGKGTRMGEIGKRLPKVLWPIFEKSILELEVAYAKELGAKKVYINTHYHTSDLKKFVQNNKSFADVELLIEDAPIDIGGAVHNLAQKLNYQGELLVLNSDQFIMLDDKAWERAFNSFEQNDAHIFAYEVYKEDKYNGLSLQDGLLQGIRPNADFKKGEKMLTYTGMALLKLEALEKTEGESKFFESVANPRSLKVSVQSIEDSPYWDFGTLKRFWDSCFKVLERHKKARPGPFVEFLIRHGAFVPERAYDKSYGARGQDLIDLSASPIAGRSNKIVLKDSELGLRDDAKAILYGEIEERGL